MSEPCPTVGDESGYESGYDSRDDSGYGSDSEPEPPVRKAVTFARDIDRIRTYRGTDPSVLAWADAKKTAWTDSRLKELEETDFV